MLEHVASTCQKLDAQAEYRGGGGGGGLLPERHFAGKAEGLVDLDFDAFGGFQPHNSFTWMHI